MPATRASGPSLGNPAVNAPTRPAPTSLIWLAVPAVLGTVALLVVTRKGAYASPDSAFYVGVARNLIGGEGLAAPPGSAPLAHFPPLFPLLLAVVGWLGFDPLDAASVVNPILLGVTALLVALVVHRAMGSVAVATMTSAAVVVSLDVVGYHGAALSEPLFVLLSLACLATLAAHADTGHRRWLVASAAFAASATLTRYAGISLVLTGAAVVILWPAPKGRGKLGSRLLGAAGYFAVAVAPVAAWMAWAGSGDRVRGFHPPGTTFVVATLRSLSAWVVPNWIRWPVRGWVALVAAAVFLALAVVAARAARAARAEVDGSDATTAAAPRPPRCSPLSRVVGVFSLSYVALVMVTRTFLDASGDVDLRLLLPLHVVALVAAAVALGPLVGGDSPLWWRRRLGAVAIAFVAVHAVQAGQWGGEGLSDDSLVRRGLTARAWTESRVIAAVSSLPPDVEVYSNAPDAIYLLTGRRALSLPPTVDYLTGKPNTGHAAAMQALLAASESRLVALAWFDAATWRQEYLATEHETVTALGITEPPALDDDVGHLYPLSISATR